MAVIVPTLNEAGTIEACLRNLAAQEADEVVVVDADSPDGTADLARSCGARVLRSSRGRGAEQNEGARASSSEILLFLHADGRLDPGAIASLRRYAARHPKIPGGCFRMRVEAPDPAFRLIDASAHLRAGILGIPYGDQGIFARRTAFQAVGGFPEIRLMDDAILALRLRRLGRLALLSPTIHASPRRWKAKGLIRQTLLNWALTALATLGTPPDRLARFYEAVR